MTISAPTRELNIGSLKRSTRAIGDETFSVLSGSNSNLEKTFKRNITQLCSISNALMSASYTPHLFNINEALVSLQRRVRENIELIGEYHERYDESCIDHADDNDNPHMSNIEIESLNSAYTLGRNSIHDLENRIKLLRQSEYLTDSDYDQILLNSANQFLGACENRISFYFCKNRVSY